MVLLLLCADIWPMSKLSVWPQTCALMSGVARAQGGGIIGTQKLGPQHMITPLHTRIYEESTKRQEASQVDEHWQPLMYYGTTIPTPSVNLKV